ncbi:hypothetical protein J5N97_007394 [Dioscorea zingiberensis]|uniref:Pentatricopeptide repeat-containing protein n=1 Tax=Dioscorea zingiberensis TaxID=325984 RepID=A0A9D5DBP2_9LILI|nr:hypothetical protein J5N97_007394 [Dioscorea zingiberensis]
MRRNVVLGRGPEFRLGGAVPRLLSAIGDVIEVLWEAKQLHALLVTAGLSCHPSLPAKLLRCYANHGDIFSARLLFDQTPHRTVLLWNSLIRAHARRRDFLVAFSLFNHMRYSGANPDSFTFACILRACAENSDPFGARTVHGSIISCGLVSDSIPGAALVNAYSKLDLFDDAHCVFDEMPDKDLVSWNSMIIGCSYGGNAQKGLELFHGLRESGERPDGYTLAGLISCLWGSDFARIGEGIHGLCLKGGYESNCHVRSALVSMYSRCNVLHSASLLFWSLPQADLVTWSAVITGFSQAGECEESIRLFREMMASTQFVATPDAVLIAVLLSACASLASIQPCKEVHGFAMRAGIDLNVTVSCALIDAYSKCGFAQHGFRIFEMMPRRTLVAYNTVMLSMGSNGLGGEAMQIFAAMLDEGLKPDKATFSALLCACCHSGLEKEGRNLFSRMHNEFGVEPETDHYVYIVKLLGMVGQLKEAYDLIQAMPMVPDSGVWGALLWGCSIHGNREFGEIVAQKLFEIEPRKTAYRIMLSNIYAVEEKWSDVKFLRNEIVEEGLHKIPGLSWIEN